MIIGEDGDRSPLKVVAWGNGYEHFASGRGWVGHMAGRSILEQPDRAYARWIAGAYERQLKRNETSTEEIEASVWLPGRGRTNIRYRRLLGTLRLQGRTCLISSSETIACD